MTLTKRIRSFFSRTSPSPTPIASVVGNSALVAPAASMLLNQPEHQSFLAVYPKVETLPNWLADEENLRDEGVLFGLSDARPDGKIAQIRSHFGQQAALLDEVIDQHTDKISELNLFIQQRENRITSLSDQVSYLRESQPVAHAILRNGISLLLSIALCIGNFYLIEDTLRPTFPNRWIAVGIFLAGMFNLFGRTSFFYETSTRLTGRRLVEELALPFAASIFVLTQALQSQSVGQAIGLFVFVFFLFLLAGKLLLSTLASLQTDVSIIQKNRILLTQKAQKLPIWEASMNQLSQEIDTIRTQKWPVVTALNHAEAERTRLNTQRDTFVNLFMSEFELARSLRDRLTQQQRDTMMNGAPERL